MVQRPQYGLLVNISRGVFIKHNRKLVVEPDGKTFVLVKGAAKT